MDAALTHCPRCQVDWQPGIKFCGGCGLPVAEAVASAARLDPPAAGGRRGEAARTVLGMVSPLAPQAGAGSPQPTAAPEQAPAPGTAAAAPSVQQPPQATGPGASPAVAVRPSKQRTI